MSYEIREDGTYYNDLDGEQQKLSNFSAQVTEEIIYLDGDRAEKTILTCEGLLNKAKLPAVRIDADKFASMNWVLEHWGVAPIIYPGGSHKDHLRTAIQSTSKPKRTLIHTHTGWSNGNGDWKYLTAAGAITAAGYDPLVKVELEKEVRRYAIVPGKQWKKGAKASLALLSILPREVSFPSLAATLAPLHGECDFAVHISGRTGTFKSEIAGILMSHFGPKFTARSLPGSWSSTANALEAQSYRAKNALFAIDDFIPAGTSWQVKSYQKTADQIIRGQGNQAGRARMNDTSTLQETMYPRGCIFSTGEDIPEGHSVRGRMLIIEISPDTVDPKMLKEAQSQREFYSQGLAEYIKFLAEKLPAHQEWIVKRAEKIRDDHLGTGHSRTPSTIGRMIASLEHWLQWCGKIGVTDEATAKGLAKEAYETIVEAGEHQSALLEGADPVQLFVQAIITVFDSQLAHARTLRGTVPPWAHRLGWTVTEEEGIENYKANGKTIAWIDWDKKELLLDHNFGLQLVKKSIPGGLPMTKLTLMKRLKDDGVLSRYDETRQRNTVRATADGQQRQVLAISTLSLFGEESP